MDDFIYITANAATATLLYLDNFIMINERKVIDGNKTWTFVIPPAEIARFRRLRQKRTRKQIRL